MSWNQGVTVPVDVWGGSMQHVISTHEIIGFIRRKTMVPPLLSHSRRSINATGPGVDDAVILNLTRQAWH